MWMPTLSRNTGSAQLTFNKRVNMSALVTSYLGQQLAAGEGCGEGLGTGDHLGSQKSVVKPINISPCTDPWRLGVLDCDDHGAGGRAVPHLDESCRSSYTEQRNTRLSTGLRAVKVRVWRPSGSSPSNCLAQLGVAETNLSRIAGIFVWLPESVPEPVHVCLGPGEHDVDRVGAGR